MKRILVIEDHLIIQQALVTLIGNANDMIIVGSYSNCEDALANLGEDRPDLVVLDIDLPGMNGIEGATKIKTISPKTDILINTVFEDSEKVFQALCAGASGYITKNAKGFSILDSIREAFDGGAPMSPRIAKMVVQSFRKNEGGPLSAREREVLIAMSEGRTMASTAELLCVSHDTIKTHVRKIYSKLQAKNKEEAIAQARKDRII